MRYVYGMILFAFAVLAFYYATRVFYNNNRKKKIYVGFAFMALASSLWSLGYSMMQLFDEDKLFLIGRAIGIVGLFLFLIVAQVLLGLIAGYGRKAYTWILVEGILGLPIAILSVIPASVELIHTDRGIVTAFVSPVTSLAYTCYILLVAGAFVGSSVHMRGKNYMKNIRVFAQRSLIVEGLLAGGIVIDTILPAVGINWNIPASTMLQFVGLNIVYHAVHRVERNRIGLQNLADYTYNALKTPILVFNYEDELIVMNSEARMRFNLWDCDFGRKDVWKKLFGLEVPYQPGDEKKTMESEAMYLRNRMYCHFFIEPIYDDFKDYIGYIVMISDRTALHQYMHKLEESKDEALRANRAKSQFLANMSHEIRTPMNSILGFSELAMKDTSKTSEETMEYLKDIHDSAETLLAIINDILDISKIESGKMELMNAEYAFKEVVSEASTIIGLQAHRKGLEYRYEEKPGIPARLIGDKTKIRAVLINILNNGIKYTERGEVSLEASFVPTEGNKGFLQFVIRDTGVGIKEEDLSSIFDIFQRVDLSVNASTEGTGLGLSITKGFIELMGGSVEVSSEYGKGTTFTVKLEQTVAEEKKEEIGQARTDDRKFRLKDVNLLVVDDTAMNLKLIKTIISRYGGTITTAASGEESIELCKNNLYDIVFMDQMMPVMDGVTAMRQIRELGGAYAPGGSSKMIALTANVIDGAREERLKEGFDDFLGKPIKTPLLEAALMNYLREDQYYYE